MLECIQVRKSYGGKNVLDIPSLSLEKGIYCLHGMNGSGKTTLLRMIAGLTPFEGDISLDGIDLRHQPLAYRQKVSWAEAEPAYPAFLTGQELLNFYREMRKASGQQTDRLIALFRMEDYLPAEIGTYSSGMIKKLSLLLAFTGNCPLILLDEPLATLDEEAMLLLPTLILTFQRDHGCSFIFSSHQPIQTDVLYIDGRLKMADHTIHFQS